MEAIITRNNRPHAVVIGVDWHGVDTDSDVTDVLVRHGMLPPSCRVWHDAYVPAAPQDTYITEYYDMPYPAMLWHCRLDGYVGDTAVYDIIDGKSVCASCGTDWQWEDVLDILGDSCPECTAAWILDYCPDAELAARLIDYYSDSLSHDTAVALRGIMG